MARTARFVSSAGVDTYANSTNSATPMSLTTALANAAAGDDIYVKADGTYTRTADDVPTNAGTVAAPIRWIGYKTVNTDGYQGRAANFGALVTTNFPAISYNATFALDANAKAWHWFENLNITGSSTGNAGVMRTGANNLVQRCAVTNTNNAGTAKGLAMFGGFGVARDCDVSAGTTACTCAVRVEGAAMMDSLRLSAPGGACVSYLSGAEMFVEFCVCVAGSFGVDFTVAPARLCVIRNLSAYGIVTDIVRLANLASSAMVLVINSMLTDSGRVANNQFSATAQNPVVQIYNRTRDNTNADVGVADVPIWGATTTDTGNASTDYVNAAGGDFRLISQSPGKAAAFPPYLDCGALQRQESGLIRLGAGPGVG